MLDGRPWLAKFGSVQQAFHLYHIWILKKLCFGPASFISYFEDWNCDIISLSETGPQIHQWLVDSPHKVAVMWKTFTWHVIMLYKICWYGPLQILRWSDVGTFFIWTDFRSTGKSPGTASVISLLLAPRRISTIGQVSGDLQRLNARQCSGNVRVMNHWLIVQDSGSYIL